MSNQLTEKEGLQLLEHFWSIGDLRGLLFPHQFLPYDNFYDHPNTMTSVWHCSRRIGKSAGVLTILMEGALESDGSICRFGTGTQESVKEIIIPLMNALTASCPPKLKPYYHSSGRFLFPHRPNSQLVLCGLDLHPDRMRGPSTKRVGIDEAGFVEGLKYVIDDVIMAQFLTEKDPGRLILSSTSPESPAHEFVNRIARAKEDGTYIHQTIYDDSREIVRQRIPQFMKEAGGEASTTWRREYLCEIVTEENMALVPEFSRAEVRAKIIGHNELPPYFKAFTVIDLGYIDNAAVLFGYVDFQKAKRVIIDELLLNRKNSRDIAVAILKKENELWGLPGQRLFQIQRYADGQPLTIADFNEVHQCTVAKVSEDSVEAKVNRVRLDVTQGKLLISPKCVRLLSEIEYGIWNKQHTAYARQGDSFGHFDLFSALTYFVMNAPLSDNPYPTNYGLDPSKMFIHSNQKDKKSISEIMKKAFNQ